MSDAIKEFTGSFRFLSNFFKCYVAHENIVYPSAEHAYQAAKTLDRSERRRMASIITPGQAKKAGRKLLLRPDWDAVKLVVMKEILSNKFLDSSLRERLLATGYRHLEEGNYWGDTFWGVCKGQGHNHLGRLLMELREELR